MTMHPFLADPPERIDLSLNAPIDRVIAQVHFPSLHLGEKKGLATAFTDLVRKEFPWATTVPMLQFVWNLEGGEPRQMEAQTQNYRHVSADKHWELILSDNFISLVCTRYDTREEFKRHFLLAMDAAVKSLDIAIWGRLGLRYINRGPKGSRDGREEYASMLKPAYRGIPGSALMQNSTSSLFTAEWDLDGVFASVRHGYLAAGATYDPFSVVPGPNPGWVFDLDVYLHPERSGTAEPFSAEHLGLNFERLADLEYCIFRELVTEEFVKAQKGDSR